MSGYEQARDRARRAIDMPDTFGSRVTDGYYTWIAGKAVAESILALAAALRPEPVRVDFKVDAEEARAAAEEAVRGLTPDARGLHRPANTPTEES